MFDEVTGLQLPAELVTKGKKEEIDWVKSIKLYDKVPRRLAKERGKPIVKTRWVIVNKGDTENYNVRCRLVGQELKAKTKEALLAYELFSAMPPWEIVKCLFSMLVTDDVFEAPVTAAGLERPVSKHKPTVTDTAPKAKSPALATMPVGSVSHDNGSGSVAQSFHSH